MPPATPADNAPDGHPVLAKLKLRAEHGLTVVLAAHEDGTPATYGACRDVIAPLRAAGLVTGAPAAGRLGPTVASAKSIASFRAHLDLDLLASLSEVEFADSETCALLAKGPLAGRRREFARVRPFFVPCLRIPSILAAIDAGLPVDPVIAAHIAGRPELRHVLQRAPVATVSRTGRWARAGFPFEGMIGLAWRLPTDALPKDDAEVRAFGAIATAIHRTGVVSDDSDLATALLPCGRDWNARITALLRASGHAEAGGRDDLPPSRDFGRMRLLTHALMDLRDWMRAFEVEVLAPSVARAGGYTDGAAYRPYDPPADIARGLSLRSCIEFASRWRRERHGARQGDAPHNRWAAPFGMVDLGNGIVAVPLTDTGMLADEGAEGPDTDGVPGLSHCSASYGGACLSGRSVVVSLREGMDGAWRRLATLELAIGEGGALTRLIQVVGRSNAPPTRRSSRAAIKLVAMLDDGRIRPSESWLATRTMKAEGPLDRISGYDPFDDGAYEATLSRWSRWVPPSTSPRRARELATRDDPPAYLVTAMRRLTPGRGGMARLDDHFGYKPRRA